ncbi:DnaJ-like protein [Marinobacter pelagius]|uniref:DnaJ-like protein n=1 Tax=Marinobacter pelagius TaxID=379482 RepID=A0A366GGQ8_9GAMM|nr:DNA-J related domain-containing protein [Marinobacter pelagius]RBP25965.1 DnaJ-like protein [Marinobacter pelagius]
MTDTALTDHKDTEASHRLLDHQVQHLLVAVEHELRKAPRGTSELALIRALQAPPWELIGEVSFRDPESLYPVHFLLFHVLYRLRDQLAGTGESLEISPLEIRLKPQTVVSGTGPPDQEDGLRRFYLDLDQYRMSGDRIRRMMDDFWARRPTCSPESSELLRAAEVLGFDSLPGDFATVKSRFRRFIMAVHPDRGGDTASVQELNQAFSVLKSHFRLSA